MIEYTLEIFPNKPRPPVGEAHDEVRIVFDNMDTKVKYVRGETQYTQEAFNEYLTATYKNKKDAQRALDLKRVAFAKQNNYYPKRGNKFVWEYQPNDGGDEPKRYA